MKWPSRWMNELHQHFSIYPEITCGHNMVWLKNAETLDKHLCICQSHLVAVCCLCVQLQEILCMVTTRLLCSTKAPVIVFLLVVFENVFRRNISQYRTVQMSSSSRARVFSPLSPMLPESCKCTLNPSSLCWRWWRRCTPLPLRDICEMIQFSSHSIRLELPTSKGFSVPPLCKLYKWFQLQSLHGSITP